MRKHDGWRGRARGWAFLRKGQLHIFYNEYRAAKAVLEDALESAGGDRQLEVNCIHALGDMHYMLDEYMDARARHEESLSIYRALGNRMGMANCIQALGGVRYMLGECGAAWGRHEESLGIYRAIGNRLEKAKSLQSLKNVSLMLRGVGLGQVPSLSKRARRRYKKAPGICRAIGNWRGVNNCSSGLCGVHMQLGGTERHRPTHPARERKRGNTRKHQEKTLSKNAE